MVRLTTWFFVVVLSLLFFLLTSVSESFASTVFFDDFYSKDISRWDFFANGQNINISTSSGILSLSSGSTSIFPYVRSKVDPFFGMNSFELEVKLRFPSYTPWGDGVVIGYQAPENDVPGGSYDLRKNYFIWLWGQSNAGNLQLWTYDCPSESYESCINIRRVYSGGVPSDWMILRIKYLNEIYAVSLQIGTGAESTIYTSSRSLFRPHTIWFGNPDRDPYGNSNPRSALDIDYVKVNSLSEPMRPIIVVPGHQASWNYVQMLGVPVGNEWKIPSFITLYDNLINSLKNAGYQEGVNLFVYGYDWRKKIGDAADDLKNFVNGLGLIGKIDFVGHSYGGLVTRGYAQEWGTDKINKILEVGSPNFGTVNAYGAWEGGVFWNTKWWQKGIMEMLIHINKLDGGPLLETKIDTIRRVAPSVRDTLPTFNYLERNGVTTPETSMLQRNTSLPTLNASAGAINALVKVIGGIGTQTKQKVNIVERSAVDVLFGLWEDGKPVTDNPFVFSSEGDDTVLAFSSAGLFSNTSLINQNHGGLVSSREGIEKIFEELGLDKTKIVATASADTRERVLVVMLRSPGQLEVCNGVICNGDLGIYLPEQKLFMWPEFGDNDLTINVEPNGGTGPYKLVTGKVDEQGANWRELDGSLDSTSETDSYHLTAIFDITPPAITPHVSPEPNAAGWNNSDVTVTWTVNDPESAIVSSTGCETTIVNTETPGTDITCLATSNGGTSSSTVDIKLDKTKPNILITAPLDGNGYTLNSVILADWTTSDDLSGLDGTESGTVPPGSEIDTNTLGEKEFRVTATDIAGNTNSKSVGYDVIEYEFIGPLNPIRSGRNFNKTSTIPIKFQLKDASDGYVTSAAAWLYVNGSQAVSSGFSNIGNLFRYDFLTNQYVFNLSTKMLSPGNNSLRINLDDDTSYSTTIIIK